MSNSMHFALYPLPATDDQINERLREMSDKFNRGSNCCQNVFNPIKTVPVVDCIVSQSHIALLLEDGRICRVAYSVHSDRLDLSTTDTSKTNNVKGSLVSTVNSLGAPRLTARRGRVLRTSTTARGRGSSSVIMGNRPVVPAQYVPEDLVSQAQVVLQGKSRNLIIRELQRTNLDVNLAVNNLLSRDDEEAEDMDESQDSYLPSDDLMSLLDAGIHNDHPSVIIDADAVFPEDVFSYSSVRVRSSSNRLGRTTSSDRDRESSAPEREHMIRFGNERQYVSGSASSGPSSSRRWLEYALRDSASASDGNKSPGNANTVDGTSSNSRKRHDASQLNPFYISDQLEYWPSSDKKFTQIIGLYSELVAITNTGQLCQWKWSEPEPYKCQISDGLVLYHPKTLHLGLLNEKISQIAGQCIRASVLTENMKIATWIDESLSSVCSKLEHTAQSFMELQHGEKISSLHVCSLYTCVRLESGSVYWWGVAPFSHRKKMWEKLQARAKKLRSTNPTGSEIVTGAQVCLKNSPFYSSGAIGFTTAGGVPKVGMLVTAAWNISDTCVFKVLGTQELRKLGVTIPVLPSSNSKMDPTKEQPPSPSFSKPSQERLEMPPPPSPASSTCSEPGASPLPKRSKRITNASTVKDEDKKDEESWNLKDVVFIEDNKSNPIGRVIKIDGAYAAVRFPNKDMCDPSDVNTVLQECRLLRRDELQLIKGSSQRVPDCFQKQPKKVNIPDSSQIIKMTVSNQGIHAIIRNNNKLNYVVYSVTSGKVEQDCTFPTDPTSFLGQDQSLISLYCHGENENITLLRDGNGALYPLAKNCIDSIKDPITLDMAPTQSIGIGISPVKDCAPNQKNQIAVIVLALENQMLIPAILRSDPEYVRLTLASLEKESVNQQVMASERIDGNRNILHTAVSACFPTSNKCNIESSNEEPTTDALDLLNTNSSRNVSLHDVMVRTKSSAIRSPGSSVERENRDSNTEGSDSEMGSSPATGMPLLSWPSDPPVPNEMPFYDQNDQKSAALSVLWILTESQALKPFMKELMSAKDAQGCTPFMLAVSGRAYSAALHLFAVAQRIAKEMSTDLETQKKLLMSMIYPRGSNPDDSPLQVICCNDTCSFTWTGAEHINQDIFECKTCGLTGSLCCCTECARVCHKGHDCKLKRTSPTAYCDCWEKCKCKALIAGNQTARHQLFKKLLSETDLVTLPNSRRENILLFLVQTVGRQIIEQRQYRPLRPRSTLTRKTPDLVGNADTDMPDHDLKPPRFASRALDKVLDDWNAVKSMILSGYRGDNANIGNLTYNSCKNSLSYAAAEEQAFLTSQNGTALLDKFTHCLLVKVGVEMLDTLLGTIVRELQKRNSPNAKEAKIVARRFVRSVARIGVVLCVELTPSSYLNINNSATVWKQSQTSSQLQKCKRVFQCLLPFAIEELCEIADALIAPVRLGVARPTAPFQLVSSILDAVHGSEELLSVDPILSQNGLQASSVNEAASEPAIINSVNEERRNDVQSGASLVNSSVGADVVVGGVDDDVVDVVEGPEDGDHDASDHEHDDVAEAQENAHEESDSDSDSNLDDASYQSNVDNASAQRSATTGATAGSDAGVASLAYFSEDESADSSNAEDEEESEAAETEPDTEELAFIEDPIDRRANNVVGSTSNVSVSNPNTNSTPQGVRSNLAQHLQWALRHRELNSSTTSATATSTTGSRITPGSISGSTGLIHIDPTPGGRRTTQTTVAPLPSTTTSNETVSMATTAVSLARAFSIVIRQIASLLPTLHSLGDKNSLSPLNCVAFTHSESVSLLNYLENRLRPTWDWLITVMDSTEGQLRFGCALTNTSSTTAGTMSTFSSHVQHVPRQGTVRRSEDRLSQNAEVRAGGSSRRSTAPTSRFSTSASMDGNYARRDFLSYAMSLMRSHNNEHLDSLPVLDVASLKHVAYVFDSLIYYMRSGNEGISPNIKITETHREDWQPAESENEADEADEDIPPYNSTSTDMAIDEDSIPNVSIGTSLAKERKHPFFQRSSSTLFLGCPPPDPFATPLAEALPLADQPHLLQPTARREDLFSVPRPPVSNNSECDQEVLEALPARISLSERYDNMCSRKVDEQPSVSLNSSALLDLSATESQYSFAGNSRAQSVIAETSQNRSPIIVSGPSLSTSNKSSVIVHAASIKASNSALSSSKSNAQESERNSAQKSDYLVISKKPLSLIGNMVQHDILLGRWRLALELFGRVFVDDVGIEPGSIISELGGFPVKEAKFRRDMERRRNSQQRDITFTKMERERNSLIQQTFKELNAMYNNFSRRLSVGVPMLAVARVKVTFKDEPGEGSGVARSFYTAFAEAILSAEKLPPLDCCQAGGNRSLQYNLIQRLKSKEREREQQRRAYQSHRSQSRDSASNSRPDLNERESQSQLRYDAPPFVMPGEQQPHAQQNNGSVNLNELLSPHRQQLGVRLYSRVAQLRPSLAAKVTGMLLELSPSQLLNLFSSEEALRNKVDEAVDIVLSHGREANTNNPENLLELDVFNSRSNNGSSNGKLQGVQRTGEMEEEEDVEDNAPLFYQPGKRGFYSPRQGRCTPERLNAFRNVGRILGLCLLQNELCPIFLNRHVIKYILRRPIAWHDLAFFDPMLYESLRMLIVDAENSRDSSMLAGLDLRFSVDLCPEEGGCQVDLIPNGRNVEVTLQNIYDYVRRYASYRMVKSQERALQYLRQGIFDVLPNNALDGLTAEDFRLLLNGVGEINVQQLISYTTFNDESGDGSDHLTYFKRWLWSIIEKMSIQEKQDLVYFWTGSPALPASEEGFQPMPSITIRPADDQHLPTANTCISRLYIPLYSSKATLRSKLLMAIKTKNFGFV